MLARRDPDGGLIRSRPWETERLARVGRREASLKYPAAASNDSPWISSSAQIGAHALQPSAPVRRQRCASADAERDSLGPVNMTSERLRRHSSRGKAAEPPKDGLKWPADRPNPKTAAARLTRAAVADSADDMRWDQDSRTAAPNRAHIASMLATDGVALLPHSEGVAPTRGRGRSRCSEDKFGGRSTEVSEPPQRIVQGQTGPRDRSEKGLLADESRRLNALYKNDRNAFEEEARMLEPPEPMSDRQKLTLAAEELVRRKPYLSFDEALQQIGDSLQAQLNAGNHEARHYFKARNR